MRSLVFIIVVLFGTYVLGQTNCPDLDPFKDCVTNCTVSDLSCNIANDCIVDCICKYGYNSRSGHCPFGDELCANVTTTTPTTTTETSNSTETTTTEASNTTSTTPILDTSSPNTPATNSTSSSTEAPTNNSSSTTPPTNSSSTEVPTTTTPIPRPCKLEAGRVWRLANDCLENCLPNKSKCPKDKTWGCHCKEGLRYDPINSDSCVKECPL